MACKIILSIVLQFLICKINFGKKVSFKKCVFHRFFELQINENLAHIFEQGKNKMNSIITLQGSCNYFTKFKNFLLML